MVAKTIVQISASARIANHDLRDSVKRSITGSVWISGVCGIIALIGTAGVTGVTEGCTG